MSASMTTNNTDPYRRAADHLRAYVMENQLEVPDVLSKVTPLLMTFDEKYAPERLAALSDDELLDVIFYTAGDNKDSLCFWLEMNRVCRTYFGSIAGGSAFKFGLFQSKETGEWLAGSARKQRTLTYEEALAYGRQIRDALVAGAKIIQNAEPKSLGDYEALDLALTDAMGQQISSGDGSISIWLSHLTVKLPAFILRNGSCMCCELCVSNPVINTMLAVVR